MYNTESRSPPEKLSPGNQLMSLCIFTQFFFFFLHIYHLLDILRGGTYFYHYQSHIYRVKNSRLGKRTGMHNITMSIAIYCTFSFFLLPSLCTFLCFHPSVILLLLVFLCSSWSDGTFPITFPCFPIFAYSFAGFMVLFSAMVAV